MIQNIFSRHLSWVFKDDFQKVQITRTCLELMKEILSSKPTTTHRIALYNYCYEVSLQDKSVVNVYIELFSMSNRSLQKSLEDEIDWNNGDSLAVINIIKTLFQVLILALKNQPENEPASILEYRLLHAKVHYVSPLKIVICYLNSVFSVSLQILAVRFLTLMVEKTKMTLVGPLDLDESQLKSLFFDKIRDPIEDVTLRRAIIELIIKIVQCQPGLTRAFFGVKCRQSTDEDNSGESLEGIVVDFLENMQKVGSLRSMLFIYAFFEKVNSYFRFFLQIYNCG